MMDKRYLPPKNLCNPCEKIITTPRHIDFIVDKNGEYPTIEAARDAAREKRAAGYTGALTVAVTKGEYNISGILFDTRDSNTAYVALGEVILNGGITVPVNDFTQVNGTEAKRLHENVCENVYCVSLTKYNITAKDYGKVYAVGSYNTASKYDGDTVGVTCEVFCNDRRMTMARYPNGNGFLHIDAVMDNGDVGELPPQNYFYDFAKMRNPRGGKVFVSREESKHISGWQPAKDIFALGYFYHDWAESSTPIKHIDTEHRLVEFEFASCYAYRAGAPFYFYNVFEELDEPGEYHIDREKNLLYVYPYGDINNAKIEISLTKNELIHAENVSDMTFDGFTIKCTRSDGIYISGERNTVKNCLVTNVFGNAAVVSGSGNTVEYCEITHTGRGGIMLSGGDRNTLTSGNNRAVNNLIHDWSEVYLAYQPAVNLQGVGNICAHNEIFNSPQMAICYGGNDHLIEYNLIHDVVKQSSDAGAIYSGMSWSAYGNIMRYNCLYNIGEGDFHPCGIYWDDALSGQTAYGNILINVGDHAFLIGGGRDNLIYNNIVINAGSNGISYDDRTRDAVVNDGWARDAYATFKGRGWKSLEGIPFRNDVWTNKYPTLKTLRCDFDDFNDPDFPPNPTNSRVYANVIIDKNKRVGNIAKSVYNYGDVHDNIAYGFDEDAGFADMVNGDYTLKSNADIFKKLPGFEAIPYNKIGRE